MDCKQEQSQELEILSCIYIDDMEVFCENPIKFQIKLNYDTKMERKIALVVEFPEKYPSEPFLLNIDSTDLLPGNEIDEILKLAKKYNLENIGIPVIFDTMSLIQDKIYHFSSRKLNEEKLNAEMEKNQIIENDELSNVIHPKLVICDEKINGIEVTVESFCRWKINFELEHNIDYKKGPNDGKFDPLKITGKQFFERGMDDNTTYLEMDGEMIELDENLLNENLNDIS